MADPDPLAPSSAPPSPDSLLWLRTGQLVINPYSELFAGLSPEQMQAYNLLTEPIFQYTFGPEGPRPLGPVNPYPGLFPPSFPDPAFSSLGPEQGVPSAFGVQLYANTPEPGNVEWGEPLDDPLMAQFQSRLAAQSIGLSPRIGQLPSSPPWVTVPQPGALSAAAGFGDISSGPLLLP